MDSAQRTQYTYTCHCQALLKHKVVALVHTSLLLDFDSSRKTGLWVLTVN